MSNICPKCNQGNIVEKEKVFSCSEQQYNSETQINEGCDFVIFKNIFGTQLTIEDIEKMIDGEQVEKNCISKAEKPYIGLLSIENNQIKLSFPEKKEEKTDENGISEFSKGYNKNGITIWKTIAGSTISKEEALMLFNGESVFKDDLVKKSGDNFSANLVLNEENKIEFIFNN